MFRTRVASVPLGCWLALSGYSMTHTISGWQLGLLSGAWIAVNVAKTAWAFRITPYSDEDRTPLTVLFKVGVLLGVPTIWFLYDRVAGWLEGTAFWRVSIAFSPYAMWVYCAHEPMFGMVLELLQAGTGMCVVVYPGNVSVPDRFKQYCKHDANPAWFLLLYLIGGAVWMAALLGLGVALGRCSPRAFQWLTGGRGGKAKKSRRPPLSATAGSEEATARSDANAHVGAVATAA